LRGQAGNFYDEPDIVADSRCLVFGDDMGARSNDPAPQPQQVVSAQQARQGATGHNVRYVLGFSIVGVVIVFAIIWLAYFA
jgi:hypothetical protein